MLQKHKSLELKKHVGAIHSSNTLSLIQRKIANGLLYNAYDDLLTKEEHQISIKDLCDLIGYDSKDYKSIKIALKNLLSTVIEWNLIDKDSQIGEGAWSASSIIADATIEKSMCYYSYSNRMKQLLHRPEVYGRLNMVIQSKFKSSYGLALYENCIRYQNLNQTPWIDFCVFRRLMGVEEEKYLIFRDFKRRVLDKAISEVNQNAPIFVTPELKRSNRLVTYIRFLITNNEVTQFNSNICKFSIDVRKKLENKYGFSLKQLNSLENKYEEGYVLEKMQHIENSSNYNQGKISNLAGYLQSALENNFQIKKQANEIISKTSFISKEDKDLGIDTKKMIMETESFKSSYREYLVNCIDEFLKHTEPSQINKVLDDFMKYLEYLNYIMCIRTIKSDGLKQSWVREELACFLVKTQEYKDKFMSQDEYFEQKVMN